MRNSKTTTHTCIIVETISQSHCDLSRWHEYCVLCDKTQYGHKTPTSVFLSVSIRHIILILALTNQSAMSNGYNVKLLILPILTNMMHEYVLCTHYNATLLYQNLWVVWEHTELSTSTQLKPDTETTTSFYQLITYKNLSITQYITYTESNYKLNNFSVAILQQPSTTYAWEPMLTVMTERRREVAVKTTNPHKE